MKKFVLIVCLYLLFNKSLGNNCPCHGNPDFRCIGEPSVEDCPHGTVTDKCGCCLECAKGPGEVCGGIWNINGRCVEGYQCVKTPGGFDDGTYFEGTCE
ncbi:venom protein 302-like [Palaemon carinicauda]|uniref:venom protein 302-like n=1 Tax=Palaemon carinicauda TaxID=392227 RepID=UPI0035B60221